MLNSYVSDLLSFLRVSIISDLLDVFRVCASEVFQLEGTKIGTVFKKKKKIPEEGIFGNAIKIVL